MSRNLACIISILLSTTLNAYNPLECARQHWATPFRECWGVCVTATADFKWNYQLTDHQKSQSCGSERDPHRLQPKNNIARLAAKMPKCPWAGKGKMNIRAYCTNVKHYGENDVEYAPLDHYDTEQRKQFTNRPGCSNYGCAVGRTFLSGHYCLFQNAKTEASIDTCRVCPPFTKDAMYFPCEYHVKNDRMLRSTTRVCEVSSDIDWIKWVSNKVVASLDQIGGHWRMHFKNRAANYKYTRMNDDGTEQSDVYDESTQDQSNIPKKDKIKKKKTMWDMLPKEQDARQSSNNLLMRLFYDDLGMDEEWGLLGDDGYVHPKKRQYNLN